MITHAAVKFNVYGKEIIIPCHRHCDAFQIIKTLRPELRLQCKDSDQGFLNENDEFLTRQEAWVEAERCNQIPYCEEAITGELYSEDLW